MDKVEEARLKYLADKKSGEKIKIDLSGTDIERIPDWVPDEIDGIFDCSFCPNLRNLKGAPSEFVGGNFVCVSCNSLYSLEGAPKIVGKSFSCHGCSKVSSPKGMGEVRGAFYSDFMTNEEFQEWQLHKKALDSLDDELKVAGDIFSEL